MTIKHKYPAPPKEMHKYGKAEWRRVMPELMKLGYTAANRATLVGYCILFSDLMIMEQAFNMNPSPMIKSDNGGLKINPLIAAKRNHSAMLVTAAKSLDLSLIEKNKGAGGRQHVDEGNQFMEFKRGAEL